MHESNVCPGAGIRLAKRMPVTQRRARISEQYYEVYTWFWLPNRERLAPPGACSNQGSCRPLGPISSQVRSPARAKRARRQLEGRSNLWEHTGGRREGSGRPCRI